MVAVAAVNTLDVNLEIFLMFVENIILITGVRRDARCGGSAVRENPLSLPGGWVPQGRGIAIFLATRNGPTASVMLFLTQFSNSNSRVNVPNVVLCDVQVYSREGLDQHRGQFVNLMPYHIMF